MLARNSDLDGIVMSMKQMEDRFNKKFLYPYVFLNEEAFTEKFKKCVSCVSYDYIALMCPRRITDLTDAVVTFGLIPRDDWYQPAWIDEDRATKARDKMVQDQVIYGGE